MSKRGGWNGNEADRTERQAPVNDYERWCNIIKNTPGRATRETENEWRKPSKLGYSYEDVRAMTDEQIVKAGAESNDRLAAELANRYDVVCEKLRTVSAGADRG